MKPKTCKVCKTKFEPRYNTTQAVCSMTCAVEQVNKQKDKQAEKDRKARRAETRKAKERLKSRSDWLKEAQTAFNAYIRERDKGNACISCQKHEHELGINHFIKMVCGHYLSVGAYPELRFNRLNAHLQCTRCNGGAGKYGQFNSKAKTVTQEYKGNLIDKIGRDNVDWLEGPHEAQNWSIEDIKEIKSYYREQLKLLKQG